MSRKPKRKQVLIVAVLLAAVSALSMCGVKDPALPNDGTNGAAGKGSSGAGTAGATGGGSSTTGSGGEGIGGSSFDFGGSSAIVGTGTGGANTGAGGSGGSAGVGPDAGANNGGSMCGKVTLTTDDAGHIPSDLSDLVALINGPNATTEPYPLAPTGGGGHTHTITFTAAQIMTLRNGGTVMVRSTATENHSHLVTVSCTKK